MHESALRERAFVVPFGLGFVMFAEHIQRGVVHRRNVTSPVCKIPQIGSADRGGNQTRAFGLSLPRIPNSEHQRGWRDLGERLTVTSKLGKERCVQLVLQRGTTQQCVTGAMSNFKDVHRFVTGGGNNLWE